MENVYPELAFAAAKMSVLGFIPPSFAYLRSAMARFQNAEIVRSDSISPALAQYAMEMDWTNMGT